MKYQRMTLSLGLRSDTFYDGAERVCSCLKKAESNLAYVATQTQKLEDQKLELFQALHYKAAMEDITAETMALRRKGSALRRQINWWRLYGNTEQQACASRLMDIANEYRPFNRLSVRDCRTVAETLLRDFGSEQSQADLAALNGVQSLLDQLMASLSTLREKQALVDEANAAYVKPEALPELKGRIADTVSDIMAYLIGMVKEQPEAYGTLLDQLTTILDGANARKRKATRLVAVAAGQTVAEVPA